MSKQPDILLVMSDQHAAVYMGHEGGMVDTPCMDALAAEGTRFANHYTSCPLCVPARMSFMSGRLPTKIGVTANNHTLAETTPTWLFPLVQAGYETVLIGRMHFIGKDLRHGFTKRIGGDMTATCWAPQFKTIGQERGQEQMRCFGAGDCLKLVGSGESPVRYYDDMVVQHALEYLAQPHDKPQCIVVGTFGPHFPYIADETLYRKYLERGYLPESFFEVPDFVENNPWLVSHCKKDTSEQTARRAVAAYCALVEESDRKLGLILDAFKQYIQRSGHLCVYGYTSDHGDMAGARKMYGKQTFFEESVRIPLILAGDGIPAGQTVSTNTSIMDIGPTLCELADTDYSGRFVDGISLIPHLKGRRTSNARAVLSQFIESRGGGRDDPYGKTELAYGVMVRRGRWKYIEYHGCEEQAILFDLQTDPGETTNMLQQQPAIGQELHNIALSAADPDISEKTHLDRNQMHRWLQTYELAAGFDDSERWHDNPPTARGQNVQP